jgi:hypothetical protein
MPFIHAFTTCPPGFFFFKMGFGLYGPINPPSSVGQVFILTAMNYFTKWTEVFPLKHSQDEQVISFLEFLFFQIWSSFENHYIKWSDFYFC